MESSSPSPRPPISEVVGAHTLPNEWAVLVALFHTLRLRDDIPKTPRWAGQQAVEHTVEHIEEELREMQEATAAQDLPALIDAIVDITYLAVGLALQSGVDPTAPFMEVHMANMDKTHDAEAKAARAGKYVNKPPGWQAPRMEQILMEMGWKG